MTSRLYLYDTTLRDGAQTSGIDFSLADKLAITGWLDTLGIDYVEGGYPGANPMDTELFTERRTTRAKFAAFGMTKRAGVSLANDPGVNALLQAEADAICFVAKSWDYHVHVRARLHAGGEPGGARRLRRRRQGRRARGAGRLRALLRRATRPIPTTRSPAPAPPMTPARAGSCCATPMAARCRPR